MNTPIWAAVTKGDSAQHFMLFGSTGKGKSQALQAEADRLGISYEELKRRLEPTAEQKERARMQQEEKDRREAQRLDAVRKAYWANTDESDSDLNPLSDALCAAGVASDPTVEQLRILFMMLPANVIGQGLAWGFSDTEVGDQIHAFVSGNRDTVARAVLA